MSRVMEKELLFSAVTYGLVKELGRMISTKLAVYHNQEGYDINYTYRGRGSWGLYKTVETEEKAREELKGLAEKLTKTEAYFSRKKLKFRD